MNDSLFKIDFEAAGQRIQCFRFSHNAMATAFEIFIQHDNLKYAKQAANEAFELLDNLERLLSSYIPNSDISRISNLKRGQSAIIGIDAFDSLKQCKKIYRLTNGTFDITIGTLLEERNKYDKAENIDESKLKRMVSQIGCDKFSLSENDFTYKLNADKLKLDMGGFGKGYGIDKMAHLLAEDWDIRKVLIQGGHSTFLALENPDSSPGWPVIISDPVDRKKILSTPLLKNYSISASGLEKGDHIINPANGNPVSDKSAAWSTAPQAALCDALSTAFMVMDQPLIESFCKKNTDIAAMIFFNDERNLMKFNWDKFYKN